MAMAYETCGSCKFFQIRCAVSEPPIAVNYGCELWKRKKGLYHNDVKIPIEDQMCMNCGHVRYFCLKSLKLVEPDGYCEDFRLDEDAII